MFKWCSNMKAKTILFFEDFSVRDTLPLASYTVTEEEILSFARAFDPQPIHTDIHFKSPDFEGVIASGWHTSAIFMRMQYEGYLKNSSTIVSPGVENIQWLRPVRPGDILSGEAIVLETRRSKSKPDRGIVRCQATVMNQENKIVMELITAVLYRCKDS